MLWYKILLKILLKNIKQTRENVIFVFHHGKWICWKFIRININMNNYLKRIL